MQDYLNEVFERRIKVARELYKQPLIADLLEDIREEILREGQKPLDNYEESCDCGPNEDCSECPTDCATCDPDDKPEKDYNTFYNETFTTLKKPSKTITVIFNEVD